MRNARYQLVVLHPRGDLLRLEEAAARTGVHPEVLRRFIEFGLIQAEAGELLDAEAVHRIQIIQRLRCDLGVNLQGVGVILELLDRLKLSM